MKAVVEAQTPIHRPVKPETMAGMVYHISFDETLFTEDQVFNMVARQTSP